LDRYSLSYELLKSPVYPPLIVPDLPASPFVMGNDVTDSFNEYLEGKDYTTQPISKEGVLVIYLNQSTNRTTTR
jgi:hypothetical protein